MATARRQIFFFFLKASITDLITLLFSSLQNSEGGGYGEFNFQPLSFTLETFGKKLAETKIVARVNVKKIKAKKYLRRLLNRLR